MYVYNVYIYPCILIDKKTQLFYNIFFIFATKMGNEVGKAVTNEIIKPVTRAANEGINAVRDDAVAITQSIVAETKEICNNGSDKLKDTVSMFNNIGNQINDMVTPWINEYDANKFMWDTTKEIAVQGIAESHDVPPRVVRHSIDFYMQAKRLHNRQLNAKPREGRQRRMIWCYDNDRIIDDNESKDDVKIEGNISGNMERDQVMYKIVKYHSGLAYLYGYKWNIKRNALPVGPIYYVIDRKLYQEMGIKFTSFEESIKNIKDAYWTTNENTFNELEEWIPKDKLKAENMSNDECEMYGIKNGDIISDEHIKAVMLYVHNDMLYPRLNRTYSIRKQVFDMENNTHVKPDSKPYDYISGMFLICVYTYLNLWMFSAVMLFIDNDIIGKIKEHMEFAEWGRLLYETVEIFGEEWNNDKIVVYRGVGDMIDVSWTSTSFVINGPFSTSINPVQARDFATNRDNAMGVLLKFKYVPNNNRKLKYINICKNNFTQALAKEEELFFCGFGMVFNMDLYDAKLIDCTNPKALTIMSADELTRFIRTTIKFVILYNPDTYNDDFDSNNVELVQKWGFIIYEIIKYKDKLFNSELLKKLQKYVDPNRLKGDTLYQAVNERYSSPFICIIQHWSGLHKWNKLDGLIIKKLDDGGEVFIAENSYNLIPHWTKMFISCCNDPSDGPYFTNQSLIQSFGQLLDLIDRNKKFECLYVDFDSTSNIEDGLAKIHNQCELSGLKMIYSIQKHWLYIYKEINGKRIYFNQNDPYWDWVSLIFCNATDMKNTNYKSEDIYILHNVLQYFKNSLSIEAEFRDEFMDEFNELIIANKKRQNMLDHVSISTIKNNQILTN